MLAEIKHQTVAQGQPSTTYCEINGSKESLDKLLRSNQGATITLFSQVSQYVPATHRIVEKCSQ